MYIHVFLCIPQYVAVTKTNSYFSSLRTSALFPWSTTFNKSHGFELDTTLIDISYNPNEANSEMVLPGRATA